MNSEARLVWAVGALLGEGPVWCPVEAALRFVDIKRGALHRFDPAANRSETCEIGGQPSFIVPAEDGGFLVGSGASIRRFDGTTLGETVAKVAMPDHNRTNDATVDAEGRLWFGTMDDNEQAPTGALHCLERGAIRTSSWTAVVTNGPALNCDGTHLYHVDSGQRTIWRIPVEGNAAASFADVFLRLDENDGYPDGVVVDSEDCLWVALWDGWGVRRYAPDGTLLAEVPLPCARVTKIAFGGPDLKTVFVTTAQAGLDQASLAAQPSAGGLFAFSASAAGRHLPAVRLG